MNKEMKIFCDMNGLQIKSGDILYREIYTRMRERPGHKRIAISGMSGEESIVCDEEFQLLYKAIAALPYEQKEVVILHVQGKMKFKDIAKLQAAPIQTTLSRYNYGLNKLRSMLNSEVEK